MNDNSSNDGATQEFDEIIEDSSLKSQIINPTTYNVFKDKGDGVGVDEPASSPATDELATDDYKKEKKKGKHF